MSNLIGQIAYDKVAKEYVLLTNSICTLDHSDTDAFKLSHGENGMGVCKMVPHEAIALRVLDIDKGKPVIGWTYRGIDHTQLSCSSEMQDQRDRFDFIIGKNTKYFIGRV